MECIVECFRCYNVERKLGSIVATVVIFLAAFYGLPSSAFLTSTVRVIISIVLGVIVGNAVYVLTSESFCNWFSACRQNNGAQNAFAVHARVHV